eukprot:CAMPEP_0182887784 /NCGR_PEP_ID=MMETSP0034_2-20130328/21036_1 /TAXON_ID=156128 /ORGANISM="Nephroselmis pyriformis, Strain CCMP717" /LENGTH=230 /DNA_ID=CAMNT_0025021167 /DNA_START=138 /DNA_END=827 /DNA_ORIENTATION=-
MDLRPPSATSHRDGANDEGRDSSRSTGSIPAFSGNLVTFDLSGLQDTITSILKQVSYDRKETAVLRETLGELRMDVKDMRSEFKAHKAEFSDFVEEVGQLTEFRERTEKKLVQLRSALGDMVEMGVDPGSLGGAVGALSGSMMEDALESAQAAAEAARKVKRESAEYGRAIEVMQERLSTVEGRLVPMGGAVPFQAGFATPEGALHPAPLGVPPAFNPGAADSGAVPVAA